jgi:hypothetical protein
LESNHFVDGDKEVTKAKSLVCDLKPEQIQEIRREALRFKKEARWIGPRILTGHPVAHVHADKSRAVNFSTATRLVTVNGGVRVFLLYRYPFSWIHSIFDNLQRALTGKQALKPFRRSRWQKLVSENSFIPIIPIDVPGIIAFPYIPNWNLRDILHHRIVDLSSGEVQDILNRVCQKLNQYHEKGKAWGETDVQNIIVPDDRPGEPILCDSEVRYYPWVPLEKRKASDWFDFIFSVCGSIEHPHISCDQLASKLLSKIAGPRTKELLIDQCKSGKALLGPLSFWRATSSRLGCSRERYEAIRKAISGA